MNDLWVIKVHNMEWVKVTIGGTNPAVARYNHSAVAQGTQLLILGGMDNNYKLAKNI